MLGKIRKMLAVVLTGIFLAVPAAGCRQAAVTPEAEESFFAMDTYISIRLVGNGAEKAAADCRTEIERLEKLLSVTVPDSDIARINAAGGAETEVDPETVRLLYAASAVSERTGGLYDCTVYPLVAAWGFFGNEQTEGRVPSELELLRAYASVGYRKMQISDGKVRIPAGGGIDLGGIAKGYASDRLTDLLTADGIRHGVLSLGGNILAHGTKPDGSPWKIGIQDPEHPDAVLGVVRVSDRKVITSGGYQRFFEQDGVRYHHILDPRTGYPADSGLTSVTVVTPSGTEGDALSTALFIMGKEQALEFWKADRSFDLILVEQDGTVTVTGDLDFTPSSGSAERVS